MIQLIFRIILTVLYLASYKHLDNEIIDTYSEL